MQERKCLKETTVVIQELEGPNVCVMEGMDSDQTSLSFSTSI